AVAADHTGREIRVLWVEATGLKLDEELELPDSADVVDFLARCQLDPRMPRVTTEALLHAFIPAPHVQHTHPDAINALACARDGERLVRECFGDGAAWGSRLHPRPRPRAPRTG